MARRLWVESPSRSMVLFEHDAPGQARGHAFRKTASHQAVFHARGPNMGGIIWVIIVGFVAGILARLISPGANNPTGFILTTILGVAGAFLATLVGQAIGHYGPDQGAGFITATIGAVVVLFIWNRLVARGVISDPGNR